MQSAWKTICCTYFVHSRVAVSAVTDLNDKGFPLYTFCPEWLEPVHAAGLYEGLVDLEDILDDNIDVTEFIAVDSSTEINGSWVKSYKLITSVQKSGIDGKLNPCFTLYLPDVEKAEDLAKEVYRFDSQCLQKKESNPLQCTALQGPVFEDLDLY